MCQALQGHWHPGLSWEGYPNSITQHPRAPQMLFTISDWNGIPLSLNRMADLSRKCVQITRAIIPDDPERLLELSTCLCPEELVRAARFLSDESRTEFLFGRSLLRHLLGVRTKTAPDQLTFSYGPCGKPYLESPTTAEQVQFNISHSNGQVIIALCDNRRVGVDIERIRPETDWQPVARHCFSPAEIDALRSFPPDLRSAAFFRIWTCKEAFLKATGVGLAEPRPGIEVILIPDREPELRTSQSAVANASKWRLRSLPLGNGYVGALVVEDYIQ